MRAAIEKNYRVGKADKGTKKTESFSFVLEVGEGRPA